MTLIAVQTASCRAPAPFCSGYKKFKNKKCTYSNEEVKGSYEEVSWSRAEPGWPLGVAPLNHEFALALRAS